MSILTRFRRRAPLVRPDDLAHHEFEKTCEVITTGGKPCARPAEWMAWAKHVQSRHDENSVFACEPCRRTAEAGWTLDVRAGSVCSCGYRVTGRLSDNFRAIRL